MDCLRIHWPDLVLSSVFLLSGLIYLYISLYKKKKLASLVHLIISVTLISNSIVVIYFSKCIIESENQAIYWLLYIANLIIFLITFSSKISIYYFLSLGLGFCAMQERGFHDYSAILIFVPAYSISTVLYIYPAAGYPIAFCFFQVLYVILMKNIIGTVNYIENHRNEYSEKQLKVIKNFKTSAFWYCQICSLGYAVIGFEYFYGSMNVSVDGGLRILETGAIFFTVFLVRPRIQAGFCREMLFKDNELVRDIMIVQATIKDEYWDLESGNVIVEIPDSVGNLLCGKVM